MRATLLLVLALFLPTWPASAAPAVSEKEATYEIEVLVFENRLPDLIGNESLARDGDALQIRGLENAAVPEAAGGQPYLQSVVAPLLENDGSHRVLARAHWQQTVDSGPKPSSKPVRIASATSDELEGAIRFSMSRYLHLDVNLLFRPNSPNDPAPGVFRISEQRRVKSQETQYFDHPRFGALVRVMPVEKPGKDKKP